MSQHRQLHVSMPGAPFANLIVVESDLAFCFAEAFLDVPTPAGYCCECFDKSACRSIRKIIGFLLRFDGTPYQKPQVLTALASTVYGNPTSGPVIDSGPFAAITNPDASPVVFTKLFCQLINPATAASNPPSVRSIVTNSTSPSTSSRTSVMAKSSSL